MEFFYTFLSKHLEGNRKTYTFAFVLRTNAVTKQLLSQKERQKKEFFEKITINREVVVQEAGFFSTLYYIGVMEKEVLGRTKPINF